MRVVDATGTNIALFTDNDGAPNLLEFAFGTSPMDAASRPVISPAILIIPRTGRGRCSRSGQHGADVRPPALRGP